MEIPSTYLFPYIVSQVAGLFILIATIRNKRMGRLLFALLFSVACYINIRTAINDPDLYLTYASTSMNIYAAFINGWFKDHIQPVVIIIASGQAVIAVTMLLKDVLLKIGCAGAIIFQLAILPLGLGSAVPLPLFLAAAALLIMKTGNQQYIWKSKLAS